MEIREILALNLRAARKRKGLTQEVLADLANVDRTYISSIERKQYGVTIDLLDRMAKALGLEAADLLRPSAQAPG